ncbi:MAG: metal-dependent hydrolase [Anaerolineae bacterium]|nr:metal-dependent hydrolase [Anaerolineae bacterium]
MPVEFTYYGHACFGIKGRGATLLIDPFLTGNPLAAVSADEVEADYILVSHAHGDHLGDAVAIAQRTGATIVGNHEIATYAGNQGLTAHGLHIGGGWDFPFGRVKLTIAHHGSSFPDGSYGGNPCGFLLTIEGKNIYHACDTGLFYDMKLIGEEGIELAFLPIGDNYTMGPKDALRAVKLIEPTVVIPIHYDTFDVIKQDPTDFARAVEAETKARCVVLKPGESYSL